MKHERGIVLPFAIGGLVVAALLVPVTARGQKVSGTIQGRVADPRGAAVPGVEVAATNTATGVRVSAKTRPDGLYEFFGLPPGTYTISASRTGFKAFTASHIILHVSETYTLDIGLELGSVTSKVVVTAAALQVQTKNTQLGEVVTGSKISSLPLISRYVIDLVQTLPGVMAPSDRYGDSFGNTSVNGSQAQQNNYLLNGTSLNDLPGNNPFKGSPPINPAAVAEFSVTDGAIDAEYGRNSGAVVNITTKSGTNAFHGEAFEYFRDTSLNSRDFFANEPEVFHRNIYGGVIGGPIVRNHSFFFFSYEGLRQRAPQPYGPPQVYTDQERNGNFNDLVDPTTGRPLLAESANTTPIPEFGDNVSPCPVSGTVLCAAGTPYSRLFRTGIIPKEDFNSVAARLMDAFVPPANFGANPITGQPNEFTFNPFSTAEGNQEVVRIDEHINDAHTLWGSMFLEEGPIARDLPLMGGDLPGFGQVSHGTLGVYTVAWNYAMGPATLNQMRIGYHRLNFDTVEPAMPVLPSVYGFQINPQYPKGASVPLIALTGWFRLGFSSAGPQPRIDQTYQFNDDFSKVIVRHTLKFGFEMRRAHVTQPVFLVNNGDFMFGGNGRYSTGVPGADFLLGFPDSYSQSSGGLNDATSQSYYAYFQDQYQVRPNLTLNYGLGWQIITPFKNHFNDNRAINCLLPGEQSVIYPSAPQSLVFPGDAGCSSTGYQTGFTHFGPRLGIAWSPNLGWFSGAPGSFSIRLGGGVYFNQPEEELSRQNLLAPPFSLKDYGVGDFSGSVSLAAPFTDVACIDQQGNDIAHCSPIGPAASVPNKFPFSPPSAGSIVDFRKFEPMSLNVIDPHFGVPRAVNYNLTVQRLLASQLLLTVGYVGTSGRHLVRAFELNPILNPQICAADPSCVDQVPHQNLSSTAVQRFPGAVFASVGEQATDGTSDYNSLQVSVREVRTHGLSFLIAYTYGHSIDNGSSFEDSAGLQETRGLNVFIPSLNRGSSRFDARQRLVVSFDYALPAPSSWLRSRLTSRLLTGWRIGGITTAQGGFPIDVFDSGFTSLTCTAFSFYGCPDNPNLVGAVRYQDPRSTNAHLYFNPSAFARAKLGTFGNTARNMLRGPGIWDTDLAVFKDTKVAEAITIELRADAVNVFNHAQFSNPIGDINNRRFGQVTSTRVGPRIVQLGARVIF